MKDALSAYLHDHLAGAAYAIDLLQALQNHYKGQALGWFADGLAREIRADRQTLEVIASRFSTISIGLKESAAWLGEKISRLKLNHSDSKGLGTFEALEFLQLGIHGKLAMWRTLSYIAPGEPRLRDIDFQRLSSRAAMQAASVEQRRLLVAESTFLRPDVKSIRPSAIRI